MFELGNAEKNLLTERNYLNKYTNDNIVISLSNTNDSHSLIAKAIDDYSICLDVGCAGGYLGKFLNKEKKCLMHGIEIDPEALNIAKKTNAYKKLYDFSITDQNNENYKNFFKNKQKYDYIIFADVLEHLLEPDEIIKKFFTKLNKNGKILLSIPNIAHMDISKNLIDRKFNYNNVGLLDNTHIRFFTKNSFIDMIESINKKYNLNLEIKIIGKTIVEPKYINKYPNLYKILNKDLELCVLQYIFELKKKEKEKKIYKVEKTNYYDKIEMQLEEKNSLCQQNALKDKEILKYETIKKDLDNKIKNYEERIPNLEKEIIEISNLKKQCEIKNKELEKKYSELLDDYSELNEEYNKILYSNSWKITKPLRVLSEKINKRK